LCNCLVVFFVANASSSVKSVIASSTVVTVPSKSQSGSSGCPVLTGSVSTTLNSSFVLIDPFLVAISSPFLSSSPYS